MKRNATFILGMMCVLVMGACGNDQNASSGSGSQKVDTVAIIKDYLAKNSVADSSFIAQLQFENNDGDQFNIKGAGYAAAAMWVKGPGTKIPATLAYEQINSFVGHAGHGEIRSFHIDRTVFDEYFAAGLLAGTPVVDFKLCIADGRVGGVVDQHLRTLVVLAVDRDGKYIPIIKSGVPHIYDQISPCPVDCPPAAAHADSKVQCDYVDHPTGKCFITD